MRPPPPRPVPDWSIRIDPGILLSAWTIDDDILDFRPEPSFPSFGVRLVLSGEVQCTIGQSGAIPLRGPSLCVATAFNRAVSLRLLGRERRLRVVGIDLPSRIAADSKTLCLQTVSDGLCRCDEDDVPRLFHRPPSQPLEALAAQILACPLRGFTREIYLSGMALQFIALAMECMKQDRVDPAAAEGLSPRELDKIDSIKCLLREQCRQPPPLADLARAVGIGPKRLTTLFKRECGVGISDFLQQYRFEQAYNLLVHTDLQMSEIAYRIGYTPAHFSTAFKKRCGRYPSELRA